VTGPVVRRWSPRLPQRPIVGVLHPGVTGAALAVALKPRAGAVIWAAANRTVRTSKRAELVDLVGVPDLVELVRRADLVVACCPPAAARAMAGEVAAAAAGRAAPLIYVEANRIPAGAVREIAALLGEQVVVDAVLTGPPAYEPGRTEVWLAGPAADLVAGLFEGSSLTPRVVGTRAGEATERFAQERASTTRR
jgi:hypothetical protein